MNLTDAQVNTFAATITQYCSTYNVCAPWAWEYTMNSLMSLYNTSPSIVEFQSTFSGQNRNIPGLEVTGIFSLTTVLFLLGVATFGVADSLNWLNPWNFERIGRIVNTYNRTRHMTGNQQEQLAWT